MQHGGEETHEKRSAEGEIDILQVVEAGDNFGVEHAVSECRDGENKTYERAGSADIKECASGSNWGAN